MNTSPTMPFKPSMTAALMGGLRASVNAVVGIWSFQTAKVANVAGWGVTALPPHRTLIILPEAA